MNLIERLEQVIGASGILTGTAIEPRYASDWSTLEPCLPAAVVRPRSTEEISQIVKLCAAAGQPLVIQGGRTGVSGGAIPFPNEIALSLERMSVVEVVDDAGFVIAQAGATIEAVQSACEAKGWLFPLDLGSRGSATVGGVVATNAGGNRVLRYGMTRALTLGVDAVLADGTILRGAHQPLLKDNSGYDWKHWLIGSEGTLGIVTRATFRLWPMPRSRPMAFCQLSSFDAVEPLFALMQQATGGLSAFEIMWPTFYNFVTENAPVTRPPFPVSDQGMFALIEDWGGDQVRFETALTLAIENNLVADAVIASSERDAQALWSVRDAIGPASAKLKPFVSYDIGLPRNTIGMAAKELENTLSTLGNVKTLLLFGHFGDGNLHVMLGLRPQATDQDNAKAEAYVHNIARHYGGTISAEHGIGRLKLSWIRHRRSPAELSVMQTIKRALDPESTLNPGRVTAAIN